MHKAIAAALGASLCLCAGCFTAPPPPLMSPSMPKRIDTPAPPPVRPDDVRQENYRTIPERLADELEFAENENTSGRY